MSKNITKQQNKEFLEKVFHLLNEMGCEENTKEKNTTAQTFFLLNTRVGKMHIYVTNENVYCYTVCCRFENVEEAKNVVDCNRHSGKYNFHQGSGDSDVRIILLMIEEHFLPILNPEKVSECDLRTFL